MTMAFLLFLSSFFSFCRNYLVRALVFIIIIIIIIIYYCATLC